MSDADLLAAYRATAWTIASPHGPLTLRLDGSPAPPRLRPSGIVTAYNPASLPTSDEENRVAHEALVRAVRALALPAWPCEAGGTGPDAERWTEPGLALPGVPREVVVSLGARFGQNAVVWVEHDGGPRLLVTRDGFLGLRVGDEIG